MTCQQAGRAVGTHFAQSVVPAGVRGQQGNLVADAREISLLRLRAALRCGLLTGRRAYSGRIIIATLFVAANRDAESRVCAPITAARTGSVTAFDNSPARSCAL